MNETILSFISLHCDGILLDDVLKKSSFIRDESIPKVSEEMVELKLFEYFVGRISDHIDLFILFKFIL
jgi:hypothetical protein